MDKTIIAIIIVVILSGFLFWGFASGFFLQKGIEPILLPEGTVLFYGEDCPHCKVVEEFIAENDIRSKMNITDLEVWDNQSNTLLLGQVAEKCNIDTSQGVGVPLLYDGQNCYMGDIDIINFFKNDTKN